MLITGFTQENIDLIYDYLVIYSIMKYKKAPTKVQKFFKDRYMYARKCAKERNINLESITDNQYHVIEQTLSHNQVVYNYFLSANAKEIQTKAQEFERIIINTISNGKNELIRTKFLYDFIINYFSYSTDYVKYCLNLPLINNRKTPIQLEFDFEGELPTDKTLGGMLVIGQADANDIANLITYLGKRLHLNISTIIREKNGEHRTLNRVTLPNGKSYILDAGRAVLEKEREGKYFLIPEETYDQDEAKASTSIQGINPQNINIEEQLTALLNALYEKKPLIYNKRTQEEYKGGPKGCKGISRKKKIKNT